MIKCPKCQFENPDNTKICGECGVDLEILCPNCNNPNPPGFKFCGECGHKLSISSEVLLKELSFEDKITKIQKHLPKDLTQKILAQKDRIEGEHKQVTVMFCDMEGFTPLTEKLGPEQMYSLMDEVYEILIHNVFDYEGTVNELTGDGIMALFGAPIALEDAPQRAIRSAIAIHQEMNRFSHRIIQEKGIPPLKMRIGINTGPVIVGTLGNNLRIDFKAVGDTVNLASRMEGLAEPGTTYVTEDTFKLAEGFFRFESLGKREIKGKEKPVSVYQVIAESTRRTRFDVSAERGLAPFVGRDEELNTLELAVLKAITGQGSIVNVIGEAGIGKSRLIAELKNREVIKRVTLLEGSTISIGANLGYHLIIDLLKNWSQITEDDSEVAAFTKLENAIRTTYPEALGEILPFVATLMGVKLMGRYAERMKGIEGEALEKLILKNVRDLIIKGAQRAPLIIILEDLHWADISSLGLLESLFRLSTKERIVFINMFRPGYTETGDRIIKTIQENYPEKCIDIIIQPLDEKQTETLITNLLNIKGFDHRLKEQIIERAGGNPYFIEEVVRSFIDEGAVVRKGEGFEVTDKLSSMSIPRTINEVLMARIDRLDQKTKDLVKTASVIGRSFFYKILAEVARTIEDINSRLEYLEEIQLILERKRMEELEYLFKHALAQEAAYDSILVQRRKELHKSVADSIEKIFNERLHEFYGMLAYHYSQAEDLDKTEEYLIKAGEESLKSSASAEALHYCQQALELYLRKYGDKANLEKVAMLEKNIALALYNRGQYTESVPYFDKVLAFYGEAIPRHKITKVLKLGAAFISYVVALYLPFFFWKKNPTQEDHEFFSLYYKKCAALSATNPQEWFFHAFCMARRTIKLDPTKLETGAGYSSIGVVLFGLPGISFALSRRALTFTKDKLVGANVRAQFFYQTNVIGHNLFSGEWKDEIEIEQDLIDRNIAVGEFFYLSVYTLWVSAVHLERGNFNEVESLIRQISNIAETYENDWAKVDKFLCSALLLLKYRRLHEAMNEVDEGILFIQRTSFRVLLIIMYAVKAKTQVYLGDLHGAEDSLAQSEKIMSEMPVVPSHIADLFLNKFFYHLYLLEEAIKKADKYAIKRYRSKALSSGTKSLKIANKYSTIKIEALKLIGVYYWVIGKQRKGMRWWREAISEGQRMKYRLELSRTYFEVGKWLLEPTSKYKELDGIKAEEYLEKARVMFEEMDLQWDLDELEKLKIQMGI